MSMAIEVDTMVRKVGEIPPVAHAEAGQQSRLEFERVLALLESLEGDDWQQQTYCTEWTVREMVSHLAGSMTGSTSLREFMRQNITHPYVKTATNSVDGTNRLQVEERAGKTTEEIIAEFRQNGPIAIRNRQKLPWLVRQIPVPGVGNTDFCMSTGADFAATSGKNIILYDDE